MEIKNQKQALQVSNADLSGSTFRDVNLANSVFQDINFKGTKFRDVNLSGVDISDCNVTGMRIDGVPVAEAIELFRLRRQPGDRKPVNSGDGAARIRPFRPADEIDVIALWQTVFGYPAPHNDPATVIRQKMEVDAELFVVAEREGKVAGTAMAGYDGHRGWVYSVAVEPRLRRQGIATALVRHLEAALSGRGCLKVNLQAMEANEEAVAFYQTLGYAVEARVSMGKRL